MDNSNSSSVPKAILFLAGLGLGGLIGKKLGSESSENVSHGVEIPDVPIVNTDSAVPPLDVELGYMIIALNRHKLYNDWPDHLTPELQNVSPDYIFALTNWFGMIVDCAASRIKFEQSPSKKNSLIYGVAGRIGGGRTRRLLPVDGSMHFKYSSGAGMSTSQVVTDTTGLDRLTLLANRRNPFMRVERDMTAMILEHSKAGITIPFYTLKEASEYDVLTPQLNAHSAFHQELDKIMNGSALYTPVYNVTAQIMGLIMAECDMEVIYNKDTFLFNYRIVLTTVTQGRKTFFDRVVQILKEDPYIGTPQF